MKKQITLIACFIILTITSTVYAYYANVDDKLYDKLYKSAMNHKRLIPYHAWVSDVVGIGVVTNSYKIVNDGWDDGFVDIAVDTFWCGDPGTNSFRVHMRAGMQPPVTNTPLLFFLTKYNWLREEVAHRRYEDETPGFPEESEPVYNMDYFRSVEKEEGLWFVYGNYSWFHVNDKNTDIIDFASNLVFAVNSKCEYEFYKIMRDGCSGEPVDTRRFIDSYGSLFFPQLYFTKDFLLNVMWRDKERTKALDTSVKSGLLCKYGIDLDPPPPTLIDVK